ncbi:TIR domain-containing protein [Photobacterium chitinilyticum]|uniref:TIR domain-containing protein n=1 Tax=Photobacterium chitinilyticum TaxID=2485123 RepID=A0A444JW89_9GAMM|nr:TIR domain-containing protein [Photobacterium chitinilyticum]RWX57326.1 TIR domain-containing protein [Photobacterium chitinilyticum]
MTKEIKKNVFVSHHHKDDASVDGVARLASAKGYQLRNSSVRMKPENQRRVEEKKVSDRTIARLLRMKMRWASQVIVVIGKETHTRPWVNWEIKAAHQLGKPIIGVYENGLKEDVKLPENLEKYATSIVGWRGDSIINALEGNTSFQNPDGTERDKIQGENVVC